MSNILEILSWVAVIGLPVGYWKQVYHIHVHKEVRDLNLISHILFVISFSILATQAFIIESYLFFFKNLLVLVPVSVLTGQIIYHKNDKWEDGKDYDDFARNVKENRFLNMHKRINIKTKRAL